MSQPLVEPDNLSPPPTPRWVKLFGVVALILVLLFGILHLTGNSPGGPGSHGAPTNPSIQQP